MSDFSSIERDIKSKYPDVGIERIEVDESKGTSTFYVKPTNKSLAFLERGGVIPKIHKSAEVSSVQRREAIGRYDLDLLLSTLPASEMPIEEAYNRSIGYYYEDPVIGTVIDIMSNMASKGFENDIDDLELKYFFDSWCFDVNIGEVLDYIFLDFFRIGVVYPYKVLGNYYKKINNVSEPIDPESVKKEIDDGVAYGAKKRTWSKSHIPIEYTVLNPMLVKVAGNLLFNKVSLKMSIPPEFIQMMRKSDSELSDDEKDLKRSLPPYLKKAASTGGEIDLASNLVDMICYKKQPYERYPRPRLSRVFDSLAYKKSLRDADLSTLDGITNYILKITIGSDQYPVTQQEELQTIASLFDRPSKSFDVVWNHTLNVEKIVSPEIESVLGKNKYIQVSDDIHYGLGMLGENVNPDAAEFLMKGIIEDIRYARKQVSRWLYKEYRQIAEALGFDKIPKIRWDENILRDEILYMNIISQLVDRRMLSYNTSLEALGFDYAAELENMKDELPLVKEGVFGIVGSPFQKAANGPSEGGGGDVDIQDNQNAPEGTPSYGRPISKVSKPREKETDLNKINKDSMTKLKREKSSRVFSLIKDMDEREYKWLMKNVRDYKKNKDL